MNVKINLLFYYFVLFDRDRYKANDALQNKSFNVFLKNRYNR